MPSTLTQRRSGGGDNSSKSKPKGSSKNRRNKPANGSKSSPARSNLSSIDKMTQSSETGSVVKILIWGVVILATGIGLAVVVRNLTQQNTEDVNDRTEESIEEPEEVVIEEPEEVVVEEDATEETDTTEETTEELTEEDYEEDTTEDTEQTTEAGEYGKGDQTINENLTGNVVSITGYSYTTSASNFLYDIKLSNAETYPKVTATLDESTKTLTIKVYNLASDAIVGNGGTGSTDFAAPRNVQSVDISNSSNVTTFVFSMNTATEYKLVKTTNDDGVDVVRVDIKNS
ncbi:hypothetical protein GF389_04380 [Candidatus Dojkabacteria bacterium]|nr:hypothetical protein [Candidatus Dojkabacteria bacterium]